MRIILEVHDKLIPRRHASLELCVEVLSGLLVTALEEDASDDFTEIGECKVFD